MLIILNTSLSIVEFYTDTRKMEYLNYTIEAIISDIISDLHMLGCIETTVDARFHSILNTIERPNDDGIIMANAVYKLSKMLYDEFRQLDLWDSLGILCVEFNCLVNNDIVVQVNRPMTQPMTSIYLDHPKPPKLTYDAWRSTLYWDSDNENNF